MRTLWSSKKSKPVTVVVPVISREAQFFGQGDSCGDKREVLGTHRIRLRFSICERDAQNSRLRFLLASSGSSLCSSSNNNKNKGVGSPKALRALHSSSSSSIFVVLWNQKTEKQETHNDPEGAHRRSTDEYLFLCTTNDGVWREILHKTSECDLVGFSCKFGMFSGGSFSD